MTPRERKMLMTIRAALIMAAKAIEEYCRDGGGEVVPTTGAGVTITYRKADDEGTFQTS